jgi:hypothetical protein
MTTLIKKIRPLIVGARSPYLPMVRRARNESELLWYRRGYQAAPVDSGIRFSAYVAGANAYVASDSALDFAPRDTYEPVSRNDMFGD